jgi:quinoprotein glucose dehydrogenase
MFRLLTLISVILLFQFCKTEPKPTTLNKSFSTWTFKGGDAGSRNYSSLDQINVSNVMNLKRAWSYSCGGTDPMGRSQIQCNPIIVDTILYGTTPTLELIALHAGTGREIGGPKLPAKIRVALVSIGE